MSFILFLIITIMVSTTINVALLTIIYIQYVNSIISVCFLILAKFRTKESLTIYCIQVEDFFYYKQIIRNITGKELITESLKNIVDTSTTILKK